jgi:amidohydrolase
MNSFISQAEDLFPYTQSLRRDFHKNPELGFQEFRTSGIVVEELGKLGLEIRKGIAKTGVIALIEGENPGPTILARFDMDALPIQEDSKTDYASKIPGKMHACGHDGHTAIGLTVARMLQNRKNEFNGTVKLVFQPAEEGLGGAKLMVDEGVLNNPRPKHSLSLHLWNEKPVGWIGVTAGPVMAASETFAVKLTGKGGHGAAPHLSVDPLFAATQIVSSLQSIMSRNVPPMDTAVLSVTAINSGNTFNVIPQTAEFQGTIRTFTQPVRGLVINRFNEIVNNLAKALGCEATIRMEGVTPAVVNDPELSGRIQRITKEYFPNLELDTTERTMGSEDMAYMMDDIPGCYLFIGSANADKGLDAKHHHPRFDFDETALSTGAALMTASIIDLLS